MAKTLKITMTATSSISPGLPVEPGEIERQLALLWKQTDASKSRASLLNFVIYSEAPDAIEINTPLLADLAAEHAFRALLIQANPSAPTSGMRAWITAHCHLRGAGQKEVCSEQITFHLDGSSAGRLSSVIFAHLDTDLPLCLWWQGELPEDPDPQLWAWVDRLLVDSSSWKHPARQLDIVRRIDDLGHGRCALGDLAWTRLFHLLYSMALIFDLPAARLRINRIQSIEIHHAAGHKTTALELLGWIASRFNWNLDIEETRTVFRRPDGGAVTFEILEKPGTNFSISLVRANFDDGEASVKRNETGEFYLLDVSIQNNVLMSQMLPAGREEIRHILLSELSRSSRHPLYWPAIHAVEPLLSSPDL